MDRGIVGKMGYSLEKLWKCHDESDIKQPLVHDMIW